MTPLLSTRRALLASALGIATLGAAGGTVVAIHGSNAAPVAATITPSNAAASAATPTPAPEGDHGKGDHRMGGPSIVKLVSATTTTLTVASADGTQRTLTLGPNAKVVGPDGKPEAVTSIASGEILAVVVGGDHHRGGHGGATQSPAAATPSPSTTSSGGDTVIAVKDTGFKAA